MAEIVGGFLLPHDPLVTADPDAPSKEQGDAVRNAFKHVAKRLEELAVDTVIVVGDDHYTVFGPQCLPRCLIVIGDAAGPIEPWVRLPQEPFRINQPLAEHIMQHGFDNGIDWAVAKSITLDHSTSLPIHLCFQDKPGISAIPVLINSGVEPLIPNRRCYQIGQAMREAVLAWDGPERVAIIGTGGISHWVGMKEMGRVNVEWDQMIMAAVERGDAEAIIALSDDEIIRESGNGGLEIKNWIVALGFVDRFRGEVIEYQAVHEWVTGCGFMEIAA
ncbi:protocatechuate 3,4-dioxygenase [Novosphingobium sp.]|uniref:DODA-type extradiol aromatic ring-opening family dioxygenase n=1 Tax=Novosphingobium sp. TaxID=1874826 RepID=UPI0027345CD6|nr:protocatechuate 3,4-dioxygenase [Novosphingobium sp.]MDP3905909.1 protocatechuate 3,4-dioxygenase [Novosphingobium sp.]